MSAAMTQALHTQAGAILPTSDTAHVASAGRVEEQKNTERTDFHGMRLAGQALSVIEGERQAAQYLARLKEGEADPAELAVIVSMMYGANLSGFCRVLAKALGVQHV